MATILAAQNGNWSATSSWTGGVVPTIGDIAYLNNRTITADVNITCSAISTRAESGSTVGGTINVPTTNRTITANFFPGGGNILTLSSSMTLNIIGNIDGTTNTTTNTRGITIPSTFTLNVTGNVNGGTSNNGQHTLLCLNATNVTINIVGDCTASGSSAISIEGTSTGTVNVTGNVYGSSGNFQSSGISNSTGNMPVYVTGNCFGGSGTAANASTTAIHNTSTALVQIVGTATGGAQGSAGVYNSGTGTLRLKRAKGNSGGPGQVAPTTTIAPGVANVNLNGLVYVEEIEFGSRGAPPTVGAVKFTPALTNVCVLTLESLSQKTLSDPNNVSGLIPSASDVRFGVVYGGGNNTGSCRIPVSSSVAAGVLVDNTTGSAVLTIPVVANLFGQLIANATTN